MKSKMRVCFGVSSLVMDMTILYTT